METKVLNAKSDLDTAVESATKMLKGGEVVALPTETVYGLAADALNAVAVAKIFEAKSRPDFDPLIVHLPNREWLEKIAKVENPELIHAIADAFWPGPLTFVLPKQEIVPDIVTSGLDTVAVRISRNSVFEKIIQTADIPLAAPSANRFGKISPTSASHVVAELDGRIGLVIDDGSTEIGIESTIIKVTGDKIEILRHGPVIAGKLSRFGEVVDAAKVNRDPEAPGQLESHYAPTTPMRLMPINRLADVDGSASGLLTFGSQIMGKRFAAARNLSEAGNLLEAAAGLFAQMRELDDMDLKEIFTHPVPNHGIGVAINERLKRASSASAE